MIEYDDPDTLCDHLNATDRDCTLMAFVAVGLLTVFVLWPIVAVIWTLVG